MSEHEFCYGYWINGVPVPLPSRPEFSDAFPWWSYPEVPVEFARSTKVHDLIADWDQDETMSESAFTIEQAIAIIREKWEDADGCGSCGWKSALYEHEPIEVDDEDLARGFKWFACHSDDASESGGHRGIRIYFK